jgi:hypothetical protein
MNSQPLYKFFRLSCEEKLLLLEAAFFLILARMAIRFIPFRMLEYFFNRLPAHPELRGKNRDNVRTLVVQAIERASQILPGETVCFPRGMVAQAMLRWRKIGVILYYGATGQQGGSLKSHVWVKDGEIAVVGCRESSAYKVIAYYPNI